MDVYHAALLDLGFGVPVMGTTYYRCLKLLEVQGIRLRRTETHERARDAWQCITPFPYSMDVVGHHPVQLPVSWKDDKQVQTVQHVRVSAILPAADRPMDRFFDQVEEADDEGALVFNVDIVIGGNTNTATRSNTTSRSMIVQRKEAFLDMDITNTTVWLPVDGVRALGIDTDATEGLESQYRCSCLMRFLTNSTAATGNFLSGVSPSGLTTVQSALSDVGVVVPLNWLKGIRITMELDPCEFERGTPSWYIEPSDDAQVPRVLLSYDLSLGAGGCMPITPSSRVAATIVGAVYAYLDTTPLQTLRNFAPDHARRLESMSLELHWRKKETDWVQTLMWNDVMETYGYRTVFNPSRLNAQARYIYMMTYMDRYLQISQAIENADEEPAAA